MEIQLPSDPTTPPTEEEREALDTQIEEVLAVTDDDQQRVRDILSAVRAIHYLSKHPE